MNAVRIVGLVLILGGILGLVYDSITYTRETHSSKVGPIELTVKDRETVNVPVWAGIGAMVLGGALILYNRRKI